MRQLVLMIVVLLVSAVDAFSQNARLAEEYYRTGEYEKAAIVFKQLYDKSPTSDYYLNRFIDSKMALKDYDEAMELIQSAIKRDPKVVSLYVQLGSIYERLGKVDEANAEYRRAIDNMPSDQFQINRLANAFMTQTKYELAVEVYLQGNKVLKDDGLFAFNLAELYRRMGEREEMMRYYLIALEMNPSQINNVRNIFSRELTDEDLRTLQALIYERIQVLGDEGELYPELLEWVFIQRKDYKNALRQVKSLDRKNMENGSRVYQLGSTASFAKAYDEAIEAFDYIVKEKGPTSPYYVAAKQQLLDNKRKQLAEKRALNEIALDELEREYISFLEEYGKNRETASFMAEWAALEARHRNNIDKAIEILDEIMKMGSVNKYVMANAKLQLGDYYLIKGDIWEATLLYSQVDKEFKEEFLGEQARFKNARLSYFAGDFEWAQEQCDILKVGTSKLIANDALDLSVFIMDNLNLDTTAAAMSLYAEAELLFFQNKNTEAFAKLDSVLAVYPGHFLEDDVYYLKAQINRKERNYDLARELYEKVIADYAEEIRGDNAMFELADMLENELDKPEEAMPLYERIFIDFSGSTFAVEARKRYRALRGDKLP
jgi:tetratricopeptide (TPR) repeat protein